MWFEDIKMFLDVVIIGCVVNGFGEVKEVYIGFIGGLFYNLIFCGGKFSYKVDNVELIDELE